MGKYSKKIISLDLETTHFDPEEGRVIEAGAVECELVFDEKKKRVVARFGKAFDRLVNPEIETPHEVLELTGIGADELAAAPLWKDVYPDLKEFLAGGRIIGHNIGFDLGFLDAHGVKVQNEYFDTLEVGQTLVPLAASHSLEYLAAMFDVLEGDSHRALADAKSAAQVLAVFLNQFLGYPEDLQRQIRERLAISTIAWRDMVLDLPEIYVKSALFDPRPVSRAAGQTPSPDFYSSFLENWKDRAFIGLPLDFAGKERFFERLSREKVSAIVAVADGLFLSDLPSGQLLPSPFSRLSDAAFRRLLVMPELSDTASRMAIKILISRRVTGSDDLGEARFTGPEREFLPALLLDPRQVAPAPLEAGRVYFARLKDIFYFAKNPEADFRGRKLLLVDMAEVESRFTESATRAWNLDRARSLFAAVYPIEEDLPSVFPNVPREAESLMSALDLFFGILHLVYLRREGEFAQNLIVSRQEEESERFGKLLAPAEKLLGQVREFEKFLNSRIALARREQGEALEFLKMRIAGFGDFLSEFFLERAASRIGWLTFNSERVDLSLVPADLAPDFAGLREKFSAAALADTVLPRSSWEYFARRLGLEEWDVKTLGRKAARKTPVAVFERDAGHEQAARLAGRQDGSSIVVLPNETQLAKYFQFFTKNPPLGRAVLAYKHSGSLPALKNKLSRLSANKPAERFTLLVTTRALLRRFPRLPSAGGLILTKLPFDHPDANPQLADLGGDNFSEIVLPRSIHLLHLIFSRFLAAPSDAPDGAKEIFLLDGRALGGYNGAIEGYLNEFFELRRG